MATPSTALTAATATATTTNVLDSLPYVEQIHNDYEDYALSLIEEEMKQTKPRSLPSIPPIRFRSSLMQTEYETLIVNDEVVQRLVSFLPPKIARGTTSEEWRTHALPKMKQQLEAERIRSMVLEAEKEEGVERWKCYNQSLDNLKALWSATLQQRGEAVEEVNYQRQKIQRGQFGPEIHELTVQYQQMLYRRNQLEHAIEGLKRTGAASSSKRKREEEEEEE